MDAPERVEAVSGQPKESVTARSPLMEVDIALVKEEKSLLVILRLIIFIDYILIMLVLIYFNNFIYIIFK